MAKDGDKLQLSSEKSRASLYSKNTEHCGSLQLDGDERGWEEARCAICMDHPHNAVLLLCSSHEKGCRPYMCDTSYRHSNCLDRFRKLSSPIQKNEIGAGSYSGKELEFKLLCPLCRGQINRWTVVEAARMFMNSKTRSCSLETCDFVGIYQELRKHARDKHPSVCPTEVDPTRQQQWVEMESDRTFRDLLNLDDDDMPEWVPPGDDFSSFFSQLDTSNGSDVLDLELEGPRTLLDTSSLVAFANHASEQMGPERSFPPLPLEFDQLMGRSNNGIWSHPYRRSNLNLNDDDMPEWVPPGNRP